MTAPACPWCSKGRLQVTPYFRTLQCDACGVGTVDLHGPARIGCCVPFCRSTRGDRNGDPLVRGMEWVCSKHWRMVPRRDRARLSRAYRWYSRRFGENASWTYPAGSPNRISAVRYGRHWRRCWERCKRAAIEAAGGIG